MANLMNQIEKTEKAQKAKRAKAQAHAAQEIRVNDELRIVRVDEYNWQIQKQKAGDWKPWPRDNFYGRLPDALLALPATMLGEDARGSLADVQRSLAGIVEEVALAVRMSRI